MFIYILNFNVNTGIYGNLPFFSLQEQRPNNPDYTPGIAFIIVSKHINTRFFKMDQRGMGSNPPCGTVVDNKVTLNERFDFFLVSQKVTQGTVSPTSYNVIEDNTGIKPDVHQKLAYTLTHLYYNWPVSFL